MKKYFLGFSAILLAFTFTAFTIKPFTGEQLFRIKPWIDKTDQAAVENPFNYERIAWSAASCYGTGGADQACEIYVGVKYYTLTNNGDGPIYTLNVSDPDGNGSKEMMEIHAVHGLDSYWIVSSTGSTVSSCYNRDLF